MEKILRDKINAAIDKAIIDYQNNENLIFNNEKDNLIYKHQSLNAIKDWKKKQTCIVKNCNKKSIQKSHSIQKSASIKLISEKSHLLTPKMNSDNGNLEMISIGVNEASTFPGYCLDHEKLFEEFENLKDFKTGEHLGLQLYRTVCREIVINENHLKNIDHFEKKYKEFRDKKIHEYVLSNLDEEVLNTPTLEFKELNFKYKDSRLYEVEKRRKRLKNYLNNFLYKYHVAILNDLKKQKFQKVAYKAIVVNEVIPVAIAGRGNFVIQLKTKTKNIEILFNVLPLKGKTIIFISTLKKFTKELNQYSIEFEIPLLAVNNIEKWMIYGSDHWFIKPSIWENLDSALQKKLLTRFMDERYNIGNDLEFSIFTDLKKKIINHWKENYDKLGEFQKELLQIEKDKLTFANNG